MPAAASTRPADLADYIKARAADAEGDARRAALGYAAALDAAPANELVAIRAYRAAMEAGDAALADRALSVLERSGVAPQDSALWRLAGAVAAKDDKAATRAIDDLRRGPLAFTMPILRAWQAVGRKRDPFAALDTAADNPLFKRYGAENRALLRIARGDIDGGLAGIRAVSGLDQSGIDTRINAARLLAGSGHTAQAHALLAGNDPEVAAVAAGLGKGAKPSFGFGVSQLFTRLAGDLAIGDPTPLSIVLMRAALRADPGNDRARLLLAASLSDLGETELALETLDAVDVSGSFGPAAADARVTVLANAGQDARALAAAAALAEAPDAGVAAAQRYGDQLVNAARYTDAARMYDTAITRAGGRATWLLWLQKGGALEQAGDWKNARPALEKALKLAPNEPIVLNYLGYSSLEHGGDPAKALALVERASALEPDDPAITDSLAWAYFRLGDLAKALPLLQEAARKSPADVEINEHLGDAYWKAGREYEARYAWRAAAIYAEGDDAKRLAGKIEGGMGAQESAAR
ncbi:tetratricopeptide repeat protein [Hephaestia caeni]|uniref:Tetratricopeptide repeat protein n=1 Tax=Hephaestia caeni TaxID=645617 RepID=A0A397P9Z0_9SPHN|nr:tetratricopeptide repeat protein [Hephaestia caeni]RIA45892.1 tetratricopeptide repeat protein [Hephaestia caeni]